MIGNIWQTFVYFFTGPSRDMRRMYNKPDRPCDRRPEKVQS